VLTSAERTQVEDAFATAIAMQDQARQLISVIFRAESPQILLALPTSSSTPRDLAAFVVETCLVSRWASTPALMDLLLDYLITARGIGALAVVQQRVRDQIDPNPSEYGSTWLIGQRPFFDRRTLRERVQRLIEDNGRPILRVSPAPDSFGRTYSRYFLEHLEDRSTGAVHVVAVELGAGTGPSYQIDDLLDTVASQLGVADPLPQRVSSDHPRTAARWLLKHLMSRPGRWLLVLDGFGDRGLHPEVRQTIEALAAAVPSGQYRLRIRLVLLDYPHPLPGTTPADILEDALSPAAQIGVADVGPCLADWDAERKQQGRDGLSAGDLVKLATGLLESVPASGRVRLEALNAELSKLRELE
jgi:hypothetical protein